MFLISLLETSLLKKFITPLFIFSFIFLALVPINWDRGQRCKKMARLLFFQTSTNRNFKTFFYTSNSKNFNIRKTKKFSSEIPF